MVDSVEALANSQSYSILVAVLDTCQYRAMLATTFQARLFLRRPVDFLVYHGDCPHASVCIGWLLCMHPSTIDHVPTLSMVYGIGYGPDEAFPGVPA